jgi:hypothetical protein
MKYTHNESIIMMRQAFTEQLTITYRLFESMPSEQESFSALVTLDSASGAKEDYFIPDIARERSVAISLFERLWQSSVLPCEVESIYSDGFPEIL